MRTSTLSLSILIAFMVSTINITAQTRSSATRSSDRDARSETRNTRTDVRKEKAPTRTVNKTVVRNNDNRNSHDNRVVKVKKRDIKRYSREKTVVVTHRPERVFHDINRDRRIIRHRDIDYSYYNGRYYRERNGAYVIVAPPRGIRVRAIPSNYLTIMVGRNPYYYNQGVYYREMPSVNEYEVVDPPMGAIVPELPQDDVRAVVINGRTYFEYDNILYKAIVTRDGVQYKVMGTLGDIY